MARKEEGAILALLREPTVGAAAKACGVSESTLWRWLQEPEFQKKYRAARRQVLDQAINRLQQVTGEAVETLQRNMTCGKPSAEVRAAFTVIDQAMKSSTMTDLEDRIKALEELLATKDGKGA